MSTIRNLAVGLGIVAAGAVLSSPMLVGAAETEALPNVALTSSEGGFLDGLYNLTDNSNLTDFLNTAEQGLDGIGLGDFAESQFVSLVPSGFLADDDSALVVGHDGLNADSGTWVTNLLDATGQLHDDSLLANFNDVAGLLPNGVNYLFDQLAVDGVDLSHALGDTSAVADLDNVVNPEAVFGTISDEMVTDLINGDTGLDAFGATLADLLGVF